MAALVNYASSSSEEDERATPPAKKMRLSPSAEEAKASLPRLPAIFLDSYSSTVRTSAQDDPSLHGGRKRATPHVQGNWPAHVYLEWHPNATEAKILTELVSSARDVPAQNDKTAFQSDGRKSQDQAIHSLLENDLGVALPLHISLSRPLTFKTEAKNLFLTCLQQAITESNIRVFNVQPKDLAWHSNENSTRWFLVLRLQRSADEEMSRLLEVCNQIASEFSQPLLYASGNKHGKSRAAPDAAQKFHVSIAWSLERPEFEDKNGRRKSTGEEDGVGVPYELLGRLTELSVAFGEVKVRIGQDVHAVPLKPARGRR